MANAFASNIFGGASTAFGGAGGTSDLDRALASATSAVDQANAANMVRYDQAMQIYDELIGRYSPGGSFGEGVLSEIEADKTRSVGATMHGRISQGLTGVQGNTLEEIGQQFESEQGGKRRLALADLQMERLSSAQLNKAQFISSVNDQGPDLSMLASLASQAGQGGGGIVSGGVQDTQPFGSFSAVNRSGSVGGTSGGLGGTGLSGDGGDSGKWGGGGASATTTVGPGHLSTQSIADSEWSAEEKARGYKMGQVNVPGHDEPQWVKIGPDGRWWV